MFTVSRFVPGGSSAGSSAPKPLPFFSPDKLDGEKKKKKTKDKDKVKEKEGKVKDKGKEKKKKKEDETQKEKTKEKKKKSKLKQDKSGVEGWGNRELTQDSHLKEKKRKSTDETDESVKQGNRAKKKAKKEVAIEEPGDEESKDTEGGELPQDEPEGKKTPGSNLQAPKDRKPKEKTSGPLPSWISQGVVCEKGTTTPVNQLNLHPKMAGVLKDMEISNFFSVQAAVIPVALQRHCANDICVSAPTGSGKTLTYVIPVVQLLCQRVVTRLRCLVLVPSRDLVLQVKTVFDKFCPEFGLKVGTAYGQTSFAAEQRALVSLETDSFEHACDLPAVSSGGNSRVDILVATPGRLMDHLASTPGFTLQHLQFLVIDEADRLLNQNYQDWALEVMKAVFEPRTPSLQFSGDSGLLCGIDNTCLRSSGALPFEQEPFQKMVLSATLTRNPQKLAMLSLRNPLFFSEVSNSDDSTVKYQIPSTLTSKILVSPTPFKPLWLLHLLSVLPFKQMLIFAASLQATHRLARLLELCGIKQVGEFSSQLSQPARSKLVERFRAGQLKIVVCSDALARGMDIHTVDTVINYDTPHYIKTYVHRVGRTARAGKAGTAITMMQRKEVRRFKQMLVAADSSVSNFNAKDATIVNPYLVRYQHGLHMLKHVLATEANGKLLPHKAVPEEMLQQLRAEAERNAEVESLNVDDDKDIVVAGAKEGDSKSSEGSDSSDSD